MMPAGTTSTADKTKASNGHNRFGETDEFVAGLSAAFLNTTFLFPVNKLIFRQMAGGYKALFAAGQMRNEGVRYLYRGILPPLIQKMASVSIMFWSFKQYRKWADRKFSHNHHITNLAIASCLTGTTEAILTPLERIQMLLQDRKYHRKYRNTFDALIKMRSFGYKEYYRGMTCVLVRNCPSNILFFGLRDEIKELLQNYAQPRQKQTKDNIDTIAGDVRPVNVRRNSAEQQHEYHQTVPAVKTNDNKLLISLLERDSLFYDFLSGAILGMFISTLFYPLSVVRTRMQTRAPGTDFISILEAFMQVYSERDHKFSRFFHGCSMNVFRQFLSWGIINGSHAMVLRILHKY